jgi:hypothetical protein
VLVCVMSPGAVTLLKLSNAFTVELCALLYLALAPTGVGEVYGERESLLLLW